MNAELSITGLKSGLGHFFHRFHVLLFTLFALGGLIIAIFSINSALTISTQDPVEATANLNTTFDTATMKEIDKLRSLTQDQQKLEFPANQRTNAFQE